MISWEFLCCHSWDFYSFNEFSITYVRKLVSTRMNSSNFGQYLKSDGLLHPNWRSYHRIYKTSWNRNLSNWLKYSNFSKPESTIKNLVLQFTFQLQGSKELINYESHKVVIHKSPFQFNSNSYLNTYSFTQTKP